MRTFVLFVSLMSLLLLTCPRETPAADATDQALTGPLADYLAKADDSYAWSKRSEGKIGTATYVELILTSQTWRGIPWKHQLYILKPSTTDAHNDRALLLIVGGRWRAEYENGSAPRQLPRQAVLIAAAAESLGTPVAILCQVPQEPLFDGLVEDALISKTFEEYLRTQDPEWPLLLPMVKSAVRGMDAVSEFAQQEWDIPLKQFTVSGASKRGWTTWLTGAADGRATAIAPMVIDMLNMTPQMKHQLAAWGAFSSEIHDYTDRGLQRALDTPRGRQLQEIVDPYQYRDRLTQPKLIILGTNDAYWPLDALNLYWNDLSGDKYILYVPNNGHGLQDLPRVVGTLAAFHRAMTEGRPLPKLDWQLGNTDSQVTLQVKTDVRPREVRAWTAISPTRDFRRAQWTSSPCHEVDGAFVYQQPLPEHGYAAIYGEAVFDGPIVKSVHGIGGDGDGNKVDSSNAGGNGHDNEKSNPSTGSLPYCLSTNVKIVSAAGTSEHKDQ